MTSKRRRDVVLSNIRCYCVVCPWVTTATGRIRLSVSRPTGLWILWMGSARCSPVPIFPSPYVSRFMILVPIFPMFPSPYVTQKYSPVPLFPKLTLPSPCVPQYPCFPYSPVPMFHSPYVPQSLCSPVHLFPSPYRCSPVPVLPSPYVHQSLCSPVLFNRSVFHSLYSPNMFPSPDVPLKCFQSICKYGLGNTGTGELVGGT